MASFQLRDGSRFYYDAGEVHKEVFLRGMDFLKADSLEDQLEPQEVYRKLTEAKEPAAVLERLISADFVEFPYEIATLLNLGFSNGAQIGELGLVVEGYPGQRNGHLDWPPGLATWQMCSSVRAVSVDILESGRRSTTFLPPSPLFFLSHSAALLVCFLFGEGAHLLVALSLPTPIS